MFELLTCFQVNREKARNSALDCLQLNSSKLYTLKRNISLPSLACNSSIIQPRASTKVLTLTSDVALVAIVMSITFYCVNLDRWQIQELFPRSKSRQLSFLLTGYLYNVLPGRIGDPLALAISVLSLFSFSKRESHGAHLIPAPSLHKGAV